MDGDRTASWWLAIPPGVRRLPADLATVVAVVAAVNAAVFLPVVSDTPLRVVLGLPFVLFVPGYAFIAALFPEAGESPTGEETDDLSSTSGSRGIDGIERVALSFGLSIAIVPLLGLVLNFTPWGIRLVPIMVATSGFTLLVTWVAATRRWALPPEERFAVPYRAWLRDARVELFEPESRTDAALNVLLALSVVLAASSVAYAVAVPKQGESFTEFYLLTESGDGELVADDYPTEFTAGETGELVVGIGNREFRRVNYTVVVELQRVRFVDAGNGTRTPAGTATAGNAGRNLSVARVTDQRELDRIRASVPHNRTWQESYEVRPTLTGQRLRLAFLLYRDTPPADPGVDNAYRETHLWVNVTER